MLYLISLEQWKDDFSDTEPWSRWMLQYMEKFNLEALQ